MKPRLTAFAIQHHLFPEKRQFLQYTTTSPIMQKRLGVAGAEADLRESMNQLLEDLIKVMTLERIEINLFRGQSRDIGSPQVFGGQVLGQALVAATATVENRRYIRCTPISCAAEISIRRSSTKSIGPGTASISPRGA